MGARAPEVCNLFTVSLVDLSVAEVLAFEIGDLVEVDDGLSKVVRGFRVDVVVVVVLVVAILEAKNYYTGQFN